MVPIYSVPISATVSKKGEISSKVQMVVQELHMHKKCLNGVGDYDDDFNPAPHASGFRTILFRATALIYIY